MIFAPKAQYISLFFFFAPSRLCVKQNGATWLS